MIEPLYSLLGFCVGVLVGVTGVGGGSLMTPLLILLFGVHPAAAVGTDLLYAAATKAGGTVFHGLARSVDWLLVRRLAIGSLPATVVTLFLLSRVNLDSGPAREFITVVLSFALGVTAVVLLFRNRIVARFQPRLEKFDPGKISGVTIALGALLGVLVSITSVGAGAIGATALIILYPRLPIVRIVGSDIAHAVPLTLVAGIGHWMLGTVDWHIVGSLLAGSLPGIFLGSCLAIRLPETVLRLVLAGTLLVVSGKLVADHRQPPTSAHTAVAGHRTN
jgi:uncharacterized membrane protein YfcA